MFKSMEGVFSNKDMAVQYDLEDGVNPVMVECDGWMSLDEARELYRDLGEAISAIETHWAKN